MTLHDSSIFRLASVGSYLDALSSITDEMSLRERSNLIFLDKCLHEQWGLGQNVLLSWCPEPDGISLLLVPHYAIAAAPSVRASNGDGSAPGAHGPSEEFFKSLLSGPRRLTRERLDKVARLLGIERTYLPLREPVIDSPPQQRIIEKMIKRYGITYVPCRAVVLFDIVGFGLLNPFEQMAQLNSLSYSMNSAQSKLMSKDIGIDFSRSTTGDGFYVWNRRLSLDANVNLYHFMHLVLADNAIARSKARLNTVPRLRAGFHVGGSYEFHQSEGLNPTLYNYIVGDVTIELARIIESALADQILVGEFTATMAGRVNGESLTLNSADFVFRAAQSVAQLTGIELSGDRVDLIKCYLTGAKLGSGEFDVRRLVINDKHGMSRNVYNAKANIYRHNAEPILLGLEDKSLQSARAGAERAEWIARA